MNIIRRITYLITACLIITAVCLSASPTYAATTPSTTNNTANNGQALEIAPPVITLTVNPGQTITTKIYLRDVSKGDLIVAGQANDFVAAGESGTPRVLLEDTGNNPYSLKNWVTPPASIRLVSKEIKTMDITFRVPANASPGGHYGVIRFTATAPEVNGTGVALSASLGSLVLMTVNGKISDNMSVQEFSVNHNGKAGKLFQSGPLNFVTRLKNNGNVHEQPTGQVTITDMFGRKLAVVNVNTPPKNVLPQSIRKFESPLDKSVIGNKRLFGRYHANLKVTYGQDKKVLTSSMTFWVIPYRLIAIVITVLIAGFFILRFAIRRYNRRVIQKSYKPPHNKH
jgi:hypothetical protein